MNDSYYNLINPRVLKSKALGKIITSNFGAEQSEVVLNRTYKEFINLTGELPLLGGEKHMNSLALVDAAYCLALYRVLKSYSMTTEQIGKLYYQIYEEFLSLKPKWFRFLYGIFKYNRKYVNQYERYALETQKRKYAEDFVCTFIKGDGNNFDYGYDYSECAILKFFLSHEAGELAPYFCYVDFSLAKAYNRGLTREKTLSEGDERCEFRYKKGRETEANWPPKFLNKKSVRKQ